MRYCLDISIEQYVDSSIEEEGGSPIEDWIAKHQKVATAMKQHSSTESADRLQQVQQILADNRIAYDVVDDSIHLWNGIARIDPPYTSPSCLISANETILQRLLKLFFPHDG